MKSEFIELFNTVEEFNEEDPEDIYKFIQEKQDVYFNLQRQS